MPPLGEVPITSFFRANSQSKKRTNANLGSQITKKRKGEESGLQVDSSSSKMPRKRIDEHFPVASGSSILKKHALQTPVHKNSRTDKKQLQTPPSTNDITRLLRSNVLEPRQSISNQVAVEKTSGSFFPSPVSVTRRKPIKRISHNIETIPKSKIPDRRNSPSLDVGKEGSESFVPSSQSQPELSFILGNSKTPMHPPPRITSESSGTNNLTVRLNVHSTDTEVEVEESVIPSSQSQLALAIDKTPTKFTRPGILPLHGASTFEYIPSSQSQEIDLAIRSDDEYIPLPNLTKAPYPLRNSPIKSTGNLSRTLSDEMFPVPIQHSLFDDIFRDEDMITAQQDTDIPNPNNTVEEESVTESESENEWVAKPTAEPPERPLEHASFSSSVASPEHCCEDEADDERELESQITHSTGSTSAGTLTILSQPLAVKDFENMFGDYYDDGSYPPDFPMSLRS